MRCLPLALVLAACGGPQAASTTPQEALSYQPCALEVGTVELPLRESFALAAGDNACLLIDESTEATFVSVAALTRDAEGFELLESDLREFLRASGLLGDAPRFTGRRPWRFVDGDTEAHTFVATPPGLPERAGFAFRSLSESGAILFVGFGETPGAAESLLHSLESTRFLLR